MIRPSFEDVCERQSKWIDALEAENARLRELNGERILECERLRADVLRLEGELAEERDQSGRTGWRREYRDAINSLSAALDEPCLYCGNFRHKYASQDNTEAT